MTGRLNFSPAEILRQLLIDLALGSLVGDNDDWPIYTGSMPDTPDDCICTYDTDGRMMGRVQTDGEIQEQYGIQIGVRSRSVVDGFVKAQRICSTLDKIVYRAEVDVQLDTYRVNSIRRVTTVVALGAEPTSRRRRWTVNVLISIEPLGIGTGS